jgi:tripartite-type tricarboxylate transporter receptor subunit TctC
MARNSITILLSVLSGLSSLDYARAKETSFAGKTVSVFVGFTPGGTNDLYTRLMARHIGKSLGGNPSVVVKNMPGAGSRKLALYLQTVAPKDGTEFGNIDRSIFSEWLMQNDKTNLVDPRNLTWIGSPAQETLTCVLWHTSKIKSLDDIRTKPFIIGSVGVTSGETLAANMLNATIGTKIKTVAGYPGGAELNLAMQRGETDGRCGYGWGSIKGGIFSQVKSGEVKVVLQIALDSHPELNDVPTLGDLVKDEQTKKLLSLLLADQRVGRPLVAPPNLETGRKLELENAFNNLMLDPDFIAEAKKLNYEVLPITGDELEILLSGLFRTDPSIVEKAQMILNTR